MSFNVPHVPSSHSGLDKPYRRSPPQADLLGASHVQRPQSGPGPNFVGGFGLPPDFADIFSAVSQLPSILPAHRAMLISALQHLALSILGLRDAQQALSVFRQVFDSPLSTGLFCEADGYYDYRQTLEHPEHIHKVSDDIAKRAVGEASKVNVAKSIWRRLIPSDLRTRYTRATHHAFYTPVVRRQQSALMCVLTRKGWGCATPVSGLPPHFSSDIQMRKDTCYMCLCVPVEVGRLGCAEP